MSKYNYEEKHSDYMTPPEMVDYILKRFSPNTVEFDLDVCCTEKNIPAKQYFINGVTDGLKEEWAYLNYCNPPYKECGKWIKKAYEEHLKGNTTAMLIPARTETKYWHDYIFDENGCGYKNHVSVEFLRKGIQFLDPHNDKKPCGVFKNALAIVIFWGVYK